MKAIKVLEWLIIAAAIGMVIAFACSCSSLKSFDKRMNYIQYQQENQTAH